MANTRETVVRSIAAPARNALCQRERTRMAVFPRLPGPRIQSHDGHCSIRMLPYYRKRSIYPLNVIHNDVFHVMVFGRFGSMR